jgi:AraC family transcriptional regulator, regulatory protein of adaptative response / methylated-DNA-[protein]-cysteine methyltransferase
MQIKTATLSTPLGTLLIGATEKGLCFLGLWDNDLYLLADLQARFFGAEVHPHAGELDPILQHLGAYCHGTPDDLALEVDLSSGTEFQQSVWMALRQVPYGKTLTYSGLAALMGKPASSVRAVAHACATNPVSLVVPCHRILRLDGSLGGYYWGLARKRALLEMEGALKPQPAQNNLPFNYLT